MPFESGVVGCRLKASLEQFFKPPSARPRSKAFGETEPPSARPRSEAFGEAKLFQALFQAELIRGMKQLCSGAMLLTAIRVSCAGRPSNSRGQIYLSECRNKLCEQRLCKFYVCTQSQSGMSHRPSVHTLVSPEEVRNLISIILTSAAGASESEECNIVAVAVDVCFHLEGTSKLSMNAIIPNIRQCLGGIVVATFLEQVSCECASFLVQSGVQVLLPPFPALTQAQHLKQVQELREGTKVVCVSPRRQPRLRHVSVALAAQMPGRLLSINAVFIGLCNSP